MYVQLYKGHVIDTWFNLCITKETVHWFKNANLLENIKTGQ